MSRLYANTTPFYRRNMSICRFWISVYEVHPGTNLPGILVHESFSRIDHMQGHEAPFNKFKIIKIIQSLSFEQNENKIRNQYRNVGNEQICGNKQPIHK